MKILFTTHTYAPNRDGVQFVTQYLAEGLVKLGHEVSVVTYLYPGRTDTVKEVINGVHVRRWKARTEQTFHKGDKQGYQQYIVDNQHDFDIIINVGTQTALTDWLFPVSDSIKVPRLLYIHSIWDFKLYRHDCKTVKRLIAKLWANMRWYFYYRRNKEEFKKYALITQLHAMDYSYQFFDKAYGITSKIMENAADSSFFTKELEKIVPGKYILNVSNYDSRKNQKKCVEIFLKSHLANDWRLVLIGSRKNAYYEELVSYEKQLRTALNIEADSKVVEILTDVPRAQISSYVKQAQIYFMTSLWEAFPISIVEAMAAGVPFVSSDVGIVKYLPGGVVGHDGNELTYWLEQLSRDEQLRQKYGALGKEMALRNFQIDDKVRQLETYLTEIISSQEG